MKRIQYQLENGMNVILQPMSTAPVVAYSVWVGVGSADELPAEAGLAHVHEHMLFKGTETRGVGEIGRDVASAGGHINAFTSFDQTCYYVTLSSRFFETGLDILSDAIGHSSFDAEELERELEVIQEEIKRSEDNPSRVASRMVFETAFGTHPYRLPIIGTSESVASFEREDVVSFYEKHYVPDNMTLVVGGDIDVDNARQRIEDHFGSLASPDKAYDSVVRPEEPVQTDTRAQTTSREINQNHLRLGFHIPAVRHEDIPAIDLLSVILGYGDASHLDRTIQRREQLVHNIFASSYTPREAGLFFVGADFQRHEDREETAPPLVLRRILEEIFRYRHIEPSTVELERAKTLVESQEIYGKQTVEGLAMKLGHYQMVAGDVDFEQEYYRALRAVRPADIRQVAMRYLSAAKATVVLVQPDKDPEIDARALIEATQQAYESAQADAIDTAIDTDNSGFARLELPNGPTLVVQEDHSVETFSLRGLALGGTRFERGETAGIHKLASQLITRGTPSRGALEIAGEIESMAASLGGVSGRNSFGLAITGLTRFFDNCFDIFAECLLSATVPDEEFERELRLQREKMTARKDNLGAVNYDQFAEAFFSPHPYALPILGTEKTLQNLTPEIIRDLLHRRCDPQQMVISVVGDVTADQVANHVEHYFSTAEPTTGSTPDIAPFEKPREPSLVVGDLEREQAHVIVGFPSPQLASDDIYPLAVLYAILTGQGGRLFYELRDRQSLAYSVFAKRVLGIEASAFTIRIATSPDKISRAVAGIERELDKLRNGDLTTDELQRAQRYLIGNHDIGLQRNSSRAMTFGLDELYGLGYRRSLAYGDHISDVTVDDIHGVLKDWLDPNNRLVSIVKPPKISVDADELGLSQIPESSV